MRKIADYKDEVVHYHNQGFTTREISMFVPFAQATISQFLWGLKKAGEIGNRPNPTHQRGMAERQRLVQEAYRLGETDIHTLARRFGIKENTVEWYLVGLGRGKEPTDKAKEIALELATSDYNCHLIPALAKKYGCTRQYVYYILRNIERYLA